MALIKCGECGGELSDKAAACPKCGAKPPRKTSRVTWLVGGIFAIAVAQWVWSSARGPGNAAQNVPAAGAPISDEERAALQRAAQDKAAADARRGLIAQAAKVLRNGMHDPASFEIQEVLMMGDQAGCYTYRAKNGFGALRSAQAVLTPETKFITSDKAGFGAAWKKHCAGQSGQPLTSYVRMFVL